MYSDYDAMCDALKRVGKAITTSGLPKKLCPLVFAVTGTGRCAQGSLEVLEQLPHIKVPPSELRAFVADPANQNNKRIVISQFQSQDLAVPLEAGKKFDKQEYYQYPERFRGVFSEYLDIVNFLLNNIYWEIRFPRLITKQSLKEAVESGKSKFMGVTDISADYEGSVEFTSRFNSIEEPFLLYNPISKDFKEKIG